MAGKPVAASFRCGCWLWMRLISGHREVCLCGLDRCVCRWAAARPRDRRTRAFGSESSISKPGQALPPPTGTSARLRGPRGALNKGRCLVCWWGNRRCFEARLCPAAAHGHRDGHQPAAVCLCWFPIWPAGGCSIRSWLAACRRRVAALMTRFPRFEAVRLRFVVVRCSKCRPPR